MLFSYISRCIQILKLYIYFYFNLKKFFPSFLFLYIFFDYLYVRLSQENMRVMRAAKISAVFVRPLRAWLTKHSWQKVHDPTRLDHFDLTTHHTNLSHSTTQIPQRYPMLNIHCTHTLTQLYIDVCSSWRPAPLCFSKC